MNEANPGVKSSTERSREFRRRRRQGHRQVSIYLPNDVAAKMDRMKRKGETISDLFARALRALEAPRAVASPTPAAADKPPVPKPRPALAATGNGPSAVEEALEIDLPADHPDRLPTLVLRLMARGFGVAAVARILNDAGIPSATGMAWDKDMATHHRTQPPQFKKQFDKVKDGAGTAHLATLVEAFKFRKGSPWSEPRIEATMEYLESTGKIEIDREAGTVTWKE